MNPKYWTLGTAAKHTGKSKSTISKYIKNGTISYLERTKAGYKLDPSEVLRFFSLREPENSDIGQSRTSVEESEQQKPDPEIRLLRERIAQLEADQQRERERADEQIADLKKDRDQWRHQANGLLEGKRQHDETAAKADKMAAGWLRKLFG